jgi:hypothetical protein
MSNKIIAEVIESVENGTAELINVTVDDLKKIKGKSFKHLVEKNPEALYPFGQRLNWYELKKHGRGVKKIQRNADLFSVDEIVAAGKQVMRDDGRPMIWIPVKEGTSRRAKAQWLDVESKEGGDALVEKPGRGLAESEVYEIPAISGIDYKLGEVIQPNSETIYIPKTKANVYWHAVKAEYKTIRKNSKKSGKVYDRISEFQSLKAKAEKKNDKAEVAKYERLIAAYRKNIESSRENGAKATE